MYATFESDAVLKDGKPVGVSQWSAYTANGGHVISHGLLDLAHAKPGTEVTLLWGEPDSKRTTVDAHTVREIRATVTPAPYFEKVIKTREQ
jgi:vanillate/3-O-methylgallate O-demethylase